MDGCVVWGSRVIVPPPSQQVVLQQAHYAHPGLFISYLFIAAQQGL